MIEDEYDRIVEELAERAKFIIEEGITDKTEAIYQAINEGFIYTYDEAIVLADARLRGNISWRSDTIDWDTIMEEFVNDIEVQLLRTAE